MSKIGLIGGIGPESTVVYYQSITSGVQRKSGKPYFPNLTIESMSVFEVLEYCDREDYEGLTEYLLKGIENLHGAGCDYAAMTGITVHIVMDELQKRSPIPLVSMLDTSAEYAMEKGFKKVGLLGTLPTMNGTFFHNAFSVKGIEVVTPSEEEKQFVGKKIADELELGIIKDETREKMRSIAERMIHEDGAEAIVLGCTELPLVFQSISLDVPYINVMEIHIEKLIDLVMSE